MGLQVRGVFFFIIHMNSIQMKNNNNNRVKIWQWRARSEIDHTIKRALSEHIT